MERRAAVTLQVNRHSESVRPVAASKTIVTFSPNVTTYSCQDEPFAGDKPARVRKTQLASHTEILPSNTNDSPSIAKPETSMCIIDQHLKSREHSKHQAKSKTQAELCDGLGNTVVRVCNFLELFCLLSNLLLQFQLSGAKLRPQLSCQLCSDTVFAPVDYWCLTA